GTFGKFIKTTDFSDLEPAPSYGVLTIDAEKTLSNSGWQISQIINNDDISIGLVVGDYINGVEFKTLGFDVASQEIETSFDEAYETITDEIEYTSGSGGALIAANANTRPFISSNKDGNFLVTWTEPSNSGSDIYGKISDPSGNDITTAFQISFTTDDHINNSTSVGLPNGNHAVFWNGIDASSGEPRSKGQILSSDGQLIGSAFPISTGYASAPQPIVLENGNILVSWRDRDSDSFGSSAKIFAGDGSSVSSEFRLNADHYGNAIGAKVTELSDGNFAAVWMQGNGDGDGYSVDAGIYNPDGSPKGAEFQVNDFTAGSQGHASIVSLQNGGFAVAFQSEHQ
ncbi:MAG: hypothetical protein VXZ58_01000, partial [Actinomycetota bacterium]|nr:hypothetical protein [Actinomycetota bacterium]